MINRLFLIFICKLIRGVLCVVLKGSNFVIIYVYLYNVLGVVILYKSVLKFFGEIKKMLN